MTPVWRLIVEQHPSEGARNMALDRAIQTAVSAGRVPPTLRIYTWERPTVTLGRFQDPASVDLAMCERCGIDVVRRFTGGRGVLHDDEVTYSVVASVKDGVPRGTAASYRHLCTALLEAYARLGVGASLTRRPRGSSTSGACYLHASAADLSLGVKKLSGSAQVWMGDTVLQHGSFTISRDAEREAEVFRLVAEQQAALARETATLAEGAGGPPSREMVREAVVEGFRGALGVEFELGEPTLFEEETAVSLHSDVLVEGRNNS